ncbi:ankyrin repeat domain-containing protein [Vallitalea okinawensis]|uniref:ankyrin repeat domain-containing protein n=1 Tax=Vallitalea okinawensis TaxID=2078660 RepID=UPI000CFE3150|nr:ankyrin repeat domain-containing protein [Vallitalea okinawensis]
MKRVSFTLLLCLMVLTACMGSKDDSKDLSVNLGDEVTVTTDTTDTINTENMTEASYTIDELTNAILSNDTGLVNAIIEENLLDINQPDSEGHYPLEMVLIMDNCEIAETLLAAGADANVLTADGSKVYDLAMESSSSLLKSIFEEYDKQKSL